ncbi:MULTISPECIES: pseudouridine synthase [Trichocoleus]|uniref:RNA pseudouridylate synthase n=1 Tax=Trichocoleus desertorum GB2-A4 TaxID=2933944 RepID=A0ABV0JB50_9CYAN|nr:pseudouridine synthase [Trichocoleus sp. FACHB-46]MBD1864705.1 RluA family pseudouridine synthase [Trichocoleus sp. FACHB-46]
MAVLHRLSDFIDNNVAIGDVIPSYWYEGRCPQSGTWLRLPRTSLAEAIACGLMQQLAKDTVYSHEGKMYGVLLVELPSREQRVLKAFSGLLNGQGQVEGWVPPIPGRDQVAMVEVQTVRELDTLKQEIITLQELPERKQYQQLCQDWEQRFKRMSDRHQKRKQQRKEKRQILSETLIGKDLAIALQQLDEASRQDGIERRQLKRERDMALRSLQQVMSTADSKIGELKQQRKALSHQLQTQMQQAYYLTNFAGQSLSLEQLVLGSAPMGTGDCCAPKLLHYAATHNLKPLAMAEFWWGPASVSGDKVQGEFYGACAERCQPLMGFLLAGSTISPPSLLIVEGTKQLIFPSIEGVGEPNAERLTILYEDQWLIVVDKPAGLLSVPGRYRDRQDSVLSRLRYLLPDGTALLPVHRLDQDTSGILVLARDPETHRQLSQQFQARQVQKVYEAVLAGLVTREPGVIELSLWGDPSDRPYQKVDWQQGKLSITRFRVIAREGDYTRLEFFPVTGRTHQLRVHAANLQGLGIPILGDRLYGCNADSSRLHLHARKLRFQHPQSGKTLHLKSETPF